MKKVDSSGPLLSIGTASKRLGISPSTLRLYEEQGLLVRSRTATGRRLYSFTDLKIVDCIRTLIQEHGMNFAGVRALFSTIPCWLIKGCSEAQRSRCERSHRSLIPCWSLEGTLCRAGKDNCKRCPVYALASTATEPEWRRGILESVRKAKEGVTVAAETTDRDAE